MNFYDKYAGGTPFLPWDVILDVLGHFKKKRYAYFFLGIFKCLSCSVFRPGGFTGVV
jgi:hypothetical protein